MEATSQLAIAALGLVATCLAGYALGFAAGLRSAERRYGERLRAITERAFAFHWDGFQHVLRRDEAAEWHDTRLADGMTELRGIVLAQEKLRKAIGGANSPSPRRRPEAAAGADSRMPLPPLTPLLPNFSAHRRSHNLDP